MTRWFIAAASLLLAPPLLALDGVIRAAVVNGGGATDFGARFLDAGDRPITTLAVALPSAKP